MSLSNLFDKLWKKDQMFAEPVPDKCLLESVEEDSIQDEPTTNEAYDPLTDPVRLALNVPEILPCMFDDTVQFWLKRIQFWGKLKVQYTDPEGKKKNVSASDFEAAMTEPDELTRVFGKWTMNKKSVKSFEATREFYDATGKKRKETYFVDIELHKDLDDAFKGKF